MSIDLLSFTQDWAKPIGQVVGGPAAGAVTGWLLGRKARKNAEVQASADQTDAITRRFNALMDGYEERVKDLMAEIVNLRAQVKLLQDALGTHGFGQ